MIWNPAKLIAIFFLIVFWLLIAVIFFGCASADKVQEKEGWFPVGMDEDAQSFYNTKYNTMDNGRNNPNLDVKVYGVQY